MASCRVVSSGYDPSQVRQVVLIDGVLKYYETAKVAFPYGEGLKGGWLRKRRRGGGWVGGWGGGCK